MQAETEKHALSTHQEVLLTVKQERRRFGLEKFSSYLVTLIDTNNWLQLIETLQQEKETVLRLQQGDELAFEKIYRFYSPKLYGNLLRLLKSVPQTEQILQDVFLKVWEYRASIDPEKSFRSFLFKVAENKAYDFFRKAARDKKLEAELIALSTVDYMALEEFVADDEKLLLLRSAINKLPPQRQQVFKLCKLEGKSYREVSESLGISLSTISDHIVKATKSIREHLEIHNRALLDLIVILWLIS